MDDHPKAARLEGGNKEIYTASVHTELIRKNFDSEICNFIYPDAFRVYARKIKLRKVTI